MPDLRKLTRSGLTWPGLKSLSLDLLLHLFSSQPSDRPPTLLLPCNKRLVYLSPADLRNLTGQNMLHLPTLTLSSDRPSVDIFVVEGELSDVQDVTFTDPDQSLSEEQTYRETMSEIRSYMGWTHIPDMDTNSSNSDDNPFAGPKMQTPGKVSVQMPTEEWLCKRLSKLNITLVEGFPSHSSESSGLLKDRFI